MRLIFGLVGILGFLIAIVLFFSFAYLPYTQQVVSKGQSARTQAEQIAGVDSTLGGRVTEHVAFEPMERSGKLYGLAVKSVAAGSSYQAFYGIQPGDVIDQIGPQKVRDLDSETAKALAYEAYQRQWELGITRGGKHFMLPADMSAAAAAGGTRTLAPNPVQPTALTPGQPTQPQQPAPKPPQNTDPNMTPLQRQMDAIINFNSNDADK